MKTIEVDLGPFKNLKPVGHDSAEDYDKESGAVGSCVEDADYSTWYRSTTNDAQKLIIPLLIATGVERPVNEKATEAARARAKDASKVDPIPMNFKPYANMVKGNISEEGWKVLDQKVHELIDGKVKIDASPSARQKGPDKAALTKADEIIGDTEDSREARIEKLLRAVDGFDLDRDEEGVPERTSLARLVQEFVKASI